MYVYICISIFYRPGRGYDLTPSPLRGEMHQTGGNTRVMSCHVMSCHVMSCHVMPCHLMSCHVISC